MSRQRDGITEYLLPVFDWIRDEILHQLGLDSYVQPPGGALDGRAAVAAGLVPEPFMLELSRAGVDVQKWLEMVLSAGQPNAVHRVLAQLTAAGARVWTVNFDTLIEKAAGGRLERIAWPNDPSAGAPLMKPHGSVGGKLIVTAAQVLAGLDATWLEQLRADVDGRTVIFIGYRGRDLDFQPVWDDVLRSAARVLWFDKWADGRPVEATRKRLMLRRVDARGDLRFPCPAPFPAGVSKGALPNPSWDFIDWCRRREFGDVGPELVRQLFDHTPMVSYPSLPGTTQWATPSVQGLLGDYAAARRRYLNLALRPGSNREASGSLAASMINHGGQRVAMLLAVSGLLPRRGQLGHAREVAQRKRVAAWSRTGRHEAVLRATRQLPPEAASTYLIIRSESLRITGSLDEAAGIAKAAFTQARREGHPVRTAHAAFQECLALLWAERLDEARRCLEDCLEPYGSLAANRWVAWTDFVAGGLAVRERDPGEALARLSAAQTRFEAEALLDGVVSVMVARLAALRLAGETESYRIEMSTVTGLRRTGNPRQRYYTRGNTFTVESIDIDDAEFTRAHLHDRPTAWALYERAAESRYPLHAALGALGLTLLAAENGHPLRHARTAQLIADRIGSRLVAARVKEFLGPDSRDDPLREVFFC